MLSPKSDLSRLLKSFADTNFPRKTTHRPTSQAARFRNGLLRIN
jgi:hypothetical protein